MLTMMAMTSRGKQQSTSKNVLTFLSPLLEDISGRGTRPPRHAMSKAQTLGNMQLVMLCLEIANVVREKYLNYFLNGALR